MAAIIEEIEAVIDSVGSLDGSIISADTLVATLSAPEYSSAKCIYCGSKAYWDGQPSLISENCVLYYYTDIKNLKIGDGTSYLASLPYILERDEWGKHMDYSMNEASETLTLSKNF